MILSELVASIVTSATSVAKEISGISTVRSKLVNQVAQFLAACYLHVNGNLEQFDSKRKAQVKMVKEMLGSDSKSIWKASLASPFSNIAKVFAEHEEAETLAIQWIAGNFTTPVSQAMSDVKTETDGLEALRRYVDKKISEYSAEEVQLVVTQAIEACEASKNDDSFMNTQVPVLVS